MDQPNPAIHKDTDDESRDQVQDNISNPSSPSPPPTFDPSAFQAPLNTLPTFKPRKTNRISVLAYPATSPTPDGRSSSTLPTIAPGRNGGNGTSSLPAPLASSGPPSLMGAPASVPGAPATPPPPAGIPPPPLAAGGKSLPPPPPMRASAASDAAPQPYTRGDFRTAGIVNHWNDPPTKIFAKKDQNENSSAQDYAQMKEKLTSIIQECSANVQAAQKRMFEDTQKRLQVVVDQMDQGSIKDRLAGPLGEMIEGT
ncbi:hypothetical protein BGW38_004933, partial [Lunasporangiospora selenospora]